MFFLHNFSFEYSFHPLHKPSMKNVIVSEDSIGVQLLSLGSDVIHDMIV